MYANLTSIDDISGARESGEPTKPGWIVEPYSLSPEPGVLTSASMMCGQSLPYRHSSGFAVVNAAGVVGWVPHPVFPLGKAFQTDNHVYLCIKGIGKRKLRWCRCDSKSISALGILVPVRTNSGTDRVSEAQQEISHRKKSTRLTQSATPPSLREPGS